MGNFFSDLFGGFGEKDVNNTFLENPEYPHSQDARDTWWNKLNEWGSDPNYGAIAPDWNDIWNQTQQKIKQYYNGGPLAPGVQDKVNSSLARRGMSENPASDFLHAQVGAQEAGDLKDLGAQQDIAKNQFAETGRQNWLSSLQNLQSQKPAGEWQTTLTAKNPLADLLIPTAANAASAYATGGISQNAAGNNNSWLEQVLKGNQTTPQSNSSPIKWTDF